MKRLIAKLFLLVMMIIAFNLSYGQHRKGIPLRDPQTQQTDSLKKDSISQKDMGDVIHALFRLKPAYKQKDSIGSKPIISVVPALGYSLQSRLAVLLSGNAAFRIAPASNVSTIVSSLAYTQNKQITLPIQSSIWSASNNFNYTGEIRLYHYPQSTYGLGSSSNIDNEAPMNYNYFRFQESVLRKVTGDFYMGAGYIIDNHTDISIGSTENGTVAEYLIYKKHATKTHSTSSGFTMNGQYDSRNSPINASSGFYLSYEFRQNLKTLGSTSTWSSLLIDARKYFQLPVNSGNVLAFWSYDWLTLAGRPPYLDLPSTLWDASTNAGRGYIQGRYRGAQMLYGEMEYRYHITQNGLIGGVLFINAQTFSATPGSRLQAIQPGYGPGLRIKLNKVSKTNIDIDYGFGSQGSHGLFVNVGELF